VVPFLCPLRRRAQRVLRREGFLCGRCLRGRGRSGRCRRNRRIGLLLRCLDDVLFRFKFPMSKKREGGGGNTNHQAIVQHTSLSQPQLSHLVSQHHTCYDCCSGRPQSSPQWYGVYDMYSCFRGKCSLTMASKHIEGCSRDQVAVCAQWHLLCAVSLIRYYTVQRGIRRLAFHHFNAKFEPDRERKANDIESRANVCGGAGYFCCGVSMGHLERPWTYLW
jgi:hypothetical protein